MKLNIKNETGRLKAVVLGQPQSLGQTPTLRESYDAKSYYTLQHDIYPTNEAIIQEMEGFKKILEKYDVKVFQPSVLENRNQVFARDVSFVIDDKLIISKMIDDRKAEQEAYSAILSRVEDENILLLPDSANAEGGDIMPCDDYLFVGTYYGEDIVKLKTARTTIETVAFLKEMFPKKTVIGIELNKHDTDPYKGILHLDCTFNVVGNNKCIIYKKGFRHEKDYLMLVDIFGKENCFEVTDQEMFEMNPNVFSISPEVVVSDAAFTRMNTHFREKWGLHVEEIPYREISKMGGLLRCSTMPLVRE